MAARHISFEKQIRRAVVRRNFQDQEMRRLGEVGSVEDIRKRAIDLAPAKPVAKMGPLSVEAPEEYTRDERNALIIITAIEQLGRAERALANEATGRPSRSPVEMDGITPLTRATLEDGRDNF